MNDEENYLPWAHYKPFYELSKEGFDGIGTNSCFRVRCKLCAPALKTIGTNKTSSSNLRKHLKCVHPQYLPQLQVFGARRRKREPLEESEPKCKKLNVVYDFQGAEKKFLCQLMNEYQELVECKSTDVDLIAKNQKVWESLTIAFNEAGIGVKRNTVELKNLWEKIKVKNEKKDEKSQDLPCNMSVEYSQSTHKPEIVVSHTNFSSQNMWENSMIECEELEDSETEIHQPIVITHLRNEDSYSNVEMDSRDQSSAKYNDIQREREVYSRVEQEKGDFLLEEQLNKEKINEQQTQSTNVRVEQEIRKQMLKDEMEHRRRLMMLELYHKKSMNTIERNMKEEELKMKKEAFFAEERRKEERHQLELSLLTDTKTEMATLKNKVVDGCTLHSGKNELSALQQPKSVLSPLKGNQEGLLLLQGKRKDIPPEKDENPEIVALQRKSDDYFVLQNREESPVSVEEQVERQLLQESSPLTQDDEQEMEDD